MNIPITVVHERLGREPFAIYELVERFCDHCETRYFPDAEEWTICPMCRKRYGLEEEPIAL